MLCDCVIFNNTIHFCQIFNMTMPYEIMGIVRGKTRVLIGGVGVCVYSYIYVPPNKLLFQPTDFQKKFVTQNIDILWKHTPQLKTLVLSKDLMTQLHMTNAILIVFLTNKAHRFHVKMGDKCTLCNKIFLFSKEKWIQNFKLAKSQIASEGSFLWKTYCLFLQQNWRETGCSFLHKTCFSMAEIILNLWKCMHWHLRDYRLKNLPGEELLQIKKLPCYIRSKIELACIAQESYSTQLYLHCNESNRKNIVTYLY